MPLIKEDKNWLKTKETDYCSQHHKTYRQKMIGRYSYIFKKPYKELHDFEKGLYWYLRIVNYDALTSVFNDDNVFAWEQIRRIENKVDAILQEMKIPYQLVEDYAIIEKSKNRTISIKKNYTKEELDVYI